MTTGHPIWAAWLALSFGLCCAVGSAACTPSVYLGAEDEETGSADAGPVSCSTPAGPLEVLSSLPQVYSWLEGDWQLCTPDFGGDAPADAIGMEFGPGSSALKANGSSVGGLAYFLVQGPTGPVPGAGFAYQLTYDVSSAGPGEFQLNIHPSPNSGFGGGMRYSPSPRELEVTEGDNSTGPVLALLTAF